MDTEQIIREKLMEIEKSKNIIEWQLDDVPDISGWDLKKALQLCMSLILPFLSGALQQ